MKRKLFLLCFLLNPSVYANWVQMSNLPASSRYGSISFVVNSEIIIVGGVSSNGTYLNDTWQYSPMSDVWTQKANYPLSGITQGSSFVLNQIAFLVGGYTGSNFLNTNYAYSLTSNAWTQKNNFIGSNRYTGSAFVIDGTGYFGMGYPNTGSNSFKDLWSYDPSIDSWTSKMNLTGDPRQSPISFSLNNKGYIGLGSNTQGSTYNHLNDLWEYNPTLNIWTQKASLPAAGRGACGITTNNGFAYVAGGQSYATSNDPITFYNEVWKYDPNLNLWNFFTYLPSNRSVCNLESVNGSLYFGLGRNNNIFNSYNDWWKYTIDSISGPQFVCKNSNGVTYVAPTVFGASYVWTVPANASITSGQGTNTITTNWTNSAVSGNLQVAIIVNADTTLLSMPVQLNPGILYNNPQAICNGGSYSINGNTYSTAAVYYDTIPVANFCDSIVRTELTVLPLNLSLRNVEICQGDAYSIGLNNYYLQGVYIDTLIGYSGCDSIIVTNLSVKTIDTSIAIVSGVLLANQAGAFYQWYECTIPGLVPIPGAINQFYNAQTNGNYALIIEYNNCSDTTACVNVTSQGIEHANTVNSKNILVNQNGTFLVFIASSTIQEIRIYNQLSQQLALVKPNATKFELEKDKLESGILFYSVTTNSNQINGKIFINR